MTMRFLRYIFLMILFLPSVASATDGRWEAWSQRPADKWQDAFVTGNGTIGTMVHGTPDMERITCVHEQLFVRGWDHKKVTVPYTADLMPQVRQLIMAHKNNAADSLITFEADRQLKAMGAQQRWPLIPHPAFDLIIKDGREGRQLKGEKRAYRRTLDLAAGIAGVEYADGMTERVLSSREHNVNVISLAPAKGKKLLVTLSLEETPGRSGMHFDHCLDSAFTSVSSSACDNGWLVYRADYRYDDGGYEGVVKVIPYGGKMAAHGSELTVTGADSVLLLMAINPLDDGKSTAAENTKAYLDRLPSSFAELAAGHTRLHGEMFGRMTLDLGCGEKWRSVPTEAMLAEADSVGVTPLFLEQMHAMGRYLLISSCGKYPPPLQGIWGGGWKPMWIGGFVWDSNINLAVSSASMANLSECAESYSCYVESLLPGWRLNARNYLGCRGFLVAHYNDPENGYLTHFGPSFPWMCWAGGAGWNIRPLYEQALYEGNDSLMLSRVLPLYREMADFYDDFFTTGNDSLLHIVPSISPENAPNGNDTWLSRDATMDVAIARDVFSILIDLCDKYGLPDVEKTRYSDILHRLPDFRINSDGALAEWIDDDYADVYDHRHISHLYPVFPASQISRYHGEKKLSDAAKEALEKRFQFDTGSAHGLIHLALQASRLGEVGKVADNLNRFSRRQYVFGGLVTSHDPHHSVYNLDAVLSLPRLFMEMLVYTEPDMVVLLPAWPGNYPDGKLAGVKLAGGHTLEIEWRDGKAVSAWLTAGSDNPRYEVSCGDGFATLVLKKGEKYDLLKNLL